MYIHYIYIYMNKYLSCIYIYSIAAKCMYDMLRRFVELLSRQCLCTICSGVAGDTVHAKVHVRFVPEVLGVTFMAMPVYDLLRGFGGHR